MYFSNFAPCLLNEETSCCGHIYDITSSRRKWCHAYYFFLKTAGAETEFWTVFTHMSYDKSFLIISILFENKPVLWLKTSNVSGLSGPWNRALELVPEKNSSGRNMKRLIMKWMLFPRQSHGRRSLSYMAGERTLAPCRQGIHMKVWRGTSAHGVVLTGDLPPYGRWSDMRVFWYLCPPQCSPFSLLFFFPHRKSLKTLLQPLLTNKEFFNIGLYKSYFAKYGSYDHTSVVRAVCVFVHIDFTVMLACCPL